MKLLHSRLCFCVLLHVLFPVLLKKMAKRAAKKDTVNDANSVRIMVRKKRREEEGEAGLSALAS